MNDCSLLFQTGDPPPGATTFHLVGSARVVCLFAKASNRLQTFVAIDGIWVVGWLKEVMVEQLAFHEQVIIILSSFKLRPEGALKTKTSRALKGGLSSCGEKWEGLQMNSHCSAFPEATLDTVLVSTDTVSHKRNMSLDRDVTKTSWNLLDSVGDDVIKQETAGLSSAEVSTHFCWTNHLRAA